MDIPLSPPADNKTKHSYAVCERRRSDTHIAATQSGTVMANMSALGIKLKWEETLLSDTHLSLLIMHNCPFLYVRILCSRLNILLPAV